MTKDKLKSAPDGRIHLALRPTIEPTYTKVVDMLTAELGFRPTHTQTVEYALEYVLREKTRTSNQPKSQPV